MIPAQCLGVMAIQCLEVKPAYYGGVIPAHCLVVMPYCGLDDAYTMLRGDSYTVPNFDVSCALGECRHST